MSDEGDSTSEEFSASEDEWKPSKYVKGGESSDDDDSDFEASPLAEPASGGSVTSTERKRGDLKARSAAKQTSKKRSGLSLRAKLYNKYRPPPKTLSPSSSGVGKNSPSASTSLTNSKNDTKPNESKVIRRKTNNGENSGSSSDSSIGNYLVNPEDLDIQSSFFNVEAKSWKNPSPAPVFDCNAGLDNLSESTSDEEKDENKKVEKAFDFNNLLEYAKSLERVKESVAKHNIEEANTNLSVSGNIDNLDVYAVLALGEKQNRSHNDGEDEDDEEDDEGLGNENLRSKNQPSKLSKTKSTRIKRHTKTRPSSTVAANDTDDSDWEEVAASSSNTSEIGNLEIHVELPSRNREKKTKTQNDIELAFKRRLNRDIKERQVLLHKASLLCRFGRIFFYNRLLNHTSLMQRALKLLPSKSAYPPDRGTEIKYFQSMITWFKSAVKLKTQNLYPEKFAAKTKSKTRLELIKQIENKEARCKQDMIFIFIILLRGMGLQCRLIVNMTPLPLRPAQSELFKIKMKKDDESEDKKASVSAKNSKNNETCSGNKIVSELTVAKETNSMMKPKNKKANTNSKNQQKGEESSNCISSDNSKSSKTTKQIGNKIEMVDDIENSLHNENNQTKRNTSPNNQQTQKTVQNKNLNYTKLKNRGNKSNAKEKVENKKCLNLENYENDISTSEKNSSNSNEMRIIKNVDASKSSTDSRKKVITSQLQNKDEVDNHTAGDDDNTQKENKTQIVNKPSLSRLKRTKPKENNEGLEKRQKKKPVVEPGSVVLPKIIVHSGKDKTLAEGPSSSKVTRCTRSRSKSPQAHISTDFLLHSTLCKDIFAGITHKNTNIKKKTVSGKSPTNNKAKISTDFMQNNKRVLRSRQTTNAAPSDNSKIVKIPQLDGANDDHNKVLKSENVKKKRPNLKKIKVQSSENSDQDFEPSPPKKPKVAPALSKKNRQVVSSDDEDDKLDSAENEKQKPTAGDMWLEVWCDAEEQWVCIDIFKGKIHCVDTIRKSASPPLAYVYAFQNDLSIKDVTARYCPNWTTVVRKSRVENTWLAAAISKYLGHHTKRDIKEDQELRRIHEEKPMPTAICDYKNHPFYALERHLLKFEAIYPSNAPILGYIRKEPVYSRDCVHTLHSREIWLKQARTVKLGEKPYKIVKARPKWDRITQTVIKDQPLEIFGYWQTQDYEPPTAENGLVPRNAYGNVELFKPSMLPKKTKHIRLPGLNRICRKLGIDCANAVIGFDFHQGACHPTFDGFIICEEFEDQVIAAWHQDQEEQERKEQDKYEARVYGNWKKLIRGLLIRERLKLKYNF